MRSLHGRAKRWLEIRREEEGYYRDVRQKKQRVRRVERWTFRFLVKSARKAVMTQILTEPAPAYHAHPATNRSRLWQFIQSRRAFERNEPRPTTPEQRLGTLVHALLLEDTCPAVSIPRELCDDRGYATTKAAKAFKADAEANGQLILSQPEIIQAEAMAESVRKRLARWLARPSKREHSIYWTDERTGLNLKCRPDWIIDNGARMYVLDLKTTESNEPRQFERSIIKYGYHIQEQMYSQGVETVLEKPTQFFFVGVEKTPPYVCCVHQIGPQAAERTYGIYRHSLITLRDCLDSGNFADRWERDNTIVHNLPDWAFTAMEDGNDVYSDCA